MTEEERLSLAAVAQRLHDHIENEEKGSQKLDARLDALDSKVDRLVTAFEQGKGMIKFLSLMAGAATFVLGLVTLMKDIFIPR